jgi:hypothetical protein
MVYFDINMLHCPKTIEIVYIEKGYTTDDVQGMRYFSTISAPQPVLYVINKLESLLTTV